MLTILHFTNNRSESERPIIPSKATDWVADMKASSRISLDELCNMDKDKTMRLRACMAQLWRSQVHALWSYSTEGDVTPLVRMCRNLIAYQDVHEGNTYVRTSFLLNHTEPQRIPLPIDKARGCTLIHSLSSSATSCSYTMHALCISASFTYSQSLCASVMLPGPNRMFFVSGEWK